MPDQINIRRFQPDDEAAVVALWQECQLVVPWNDPKLDVERKLAHSPELLLVAMLEQQLIGSVMVGYDGHRGWINYLAVAPDVRNRGFARQLMEAAETCLVDCGCPKVNLLIRSTNQEVQDFYSRIGYSDDAVSCMSKRLS